MNHYSQFEIDRYQREAAEDLGYFDTPEEEAPSPEQVAFWDAVNEYVEACGGDTSNRTISNRRMSAVAAVEKAAALYNPSS